LIYIPAAIAYPVFDLSEILERAAGQNIRGTQGGVEGRYRQKGIYPFMCYPHCFCARPL